MDYYKLIEQLRTESLYADKASLEIMDLCMDAATALSTLQAENKRLNKIVCSIPTTPDSGRTVSQYDKEMSMCAYLDDLEAENEKLRAELAQMAACVYYKAGGLCQCGGDDPANVCVMGPCPHEISVFDLTQLIHHVRLRLEDVKAERDAAVKCIGEIEDALKFQRISAIGLRISEWRNTKED